MPRFLTVLLLFLVGILFVRNVGGVGVIPEAIPKERPDITEIEPKPKPPVNPTNPKPSPTSEENEEGKEEDDYDDILDALESIIDSIFPDDATTTSASLPPAVTPCLDVDYFIYSICGQIDTSFLDYPFSVQASCLCYTFGNNNLSTWAPGFFDGLMSQCYGYVHTQTQYSISQVVLESDQFSLCAMAGNVAAITSTSPAATTTATPGPTPAQSSPTSTITSASANRNVGSGSLIAIMGLWLGRTLI